MKKTIVLLIALLAPLAMLAQTVRIPGPAGEFLGVPPVINTSAAANSAASATTQTINFTAPSGAFGIVVHAFGDAGAYTVLDCAGAGPCSAPSVDNFIGTGPPSAAPVCVALGVNACQFVVCTSHLASGASSITVTVGSDATFLTVDAEAITGMASYGCVDAFGANGATTGANPSVTTSGNVTRGTDLVIGALRDANALTVGTGYTAIQNISSGGNMISQSRNATPSAGATVSSGWTATTGAWGGMVSAFAINPIAQQAQLDGSCLVSGTTTQIHCSLPAIFAGTAIIAHIYLPTTAALVSLQDCTGSSACSGTTDTLATSLACTAIGGGARILCEYYICQTALSAAGAIDVTLNTSGSGSHFMDVETYQGMAASSCLDTTGTNSGASGSPTVTTTGNIAGNNELLIGFALSANTGSVGTGNKLIRNSGGFVTEYSLASPSSGGTATSTTSAATGAWAMMNSAWKSR